MTLSSCLGLTLESVSKVPPKVVNWRAEAPAEVEVASTHTPAHMANTAITMDIKATHSLTDTKHRPGVTPEAVF